MIEDRPVAGEPPDTGLGMPRQRASFARDAERLNDSAQAFPPATSIA
ncbi:hypothetical protein [Mesorhizobium mediterraneum]|nr:hypothetical protein [Mesorhizobium mediterraneum]